MKVSFRNLALAAVMTVAGSVVAQEAVTPTLVQKWSYENIGAVSTDSRFATGYDGTIYYNDKANGKVMKISADGVPSEYASVTGLGAGITSDDAGNIIVNVGFPNAESGYHFVIIPADGSAQVDLQLTMPDGVEAARVDQVGRVAGNVLSAEGGFFFLGENGATEIVLAQVKNGAQVTDELSYYTTDPINGVALNTSALIQPLYSFEEMVEMGDDAINAFALRNRSTKNVYIVKDGELKALPCSSQSNTQEAFDVFFLNDVLYQVLPAKLSSNANYSGEYQIISEDGTVMENIELATGNGSLNFGSVVARKVSDDTVQLYIFFSAGSGVCAAMYEYTTAPAEPAALSIQSAIATNVAYNAAEVTVEYTEGVVPEGYSLQLELIENIGSRPVQYFEATGSPLTVNLTNLTAEKHYQYYAIINLLNAEGTVMNKSNLVIVEFTTPEVPPTPELVLEDVKATNITSTTADFVATYTTQYVPEGAVLTIEYTDAATRTLTSYPAEDSPMTTAVTGLQPATTYQYMAVLNLADADGNTIARSNIVYFEFTTEGIELYLNPVIVENIKDTSVDFVISYTATGVPENTSLTVEVTEYNTRVPENYPAEESPMTIGIDGLTGATAYEYMVVLRLRDADGNIIASSNIQYVNFKTTEQLATKSEFAYGLNAEGFNGQYVFSFYSTGAAASADLVLTNVITGETIETVLGTVEEGYNSYTYDAADLGGDKYNWAIRIHNYPIVEDAVSETVNVGGSRAGIATFVDPEFPDTYGFVAIGRTQNGGIDVYNPMGELVQSAVHAGCEVLGNTNTSSPMDATQRGNEVYLASWGDASYGVVAYDITTPEVAPYSVFDGTKAASGLITNAAGEAVGSGTPCVGLWGQGAQTTIITFDEDVFGNKLAQNVIGTNKTTSNPASLIGNGFNAQLLNTNVGVKGVKNGIFATQCRANGMEAVTSGLRYITMPEGESIWSADMEAENYPNLIPSTLAGVDVNPAGDLLVLSTYDGINVYLLSWNADGTPALEPYKSIAYPFGRVSTRVNVKFDAGNNIHAVSQTNGYFKVVLADEESITVTPASSLSFILSTTGVEDITVEGYDSNAVYYNLNGVRLQSEQLTPGVYVKVVDGKATKVVVK